MVLIILKNLAKQCNEMFSFTDVCQVEVTSGATRAYFKKIDTQDPNCRFSSDSGFACRYVLSR